MAREETAATSETYAFRYDPITVADRLRWARAHWQQDNRQPRDLDDLMLRAAETLERTVPKHWRTVATIQAVLMIVIGFWR